MTPPYEARHRDVYRLRDDHLTADARAALGDPGALAARVRAVAPGVHALPLFTDDFCARLLEELHRRQRFAAGAGRALRRPNSMNRDGVILEEVGFEALLDDLLARVAAPLGRWGFAHVGGDALDHHHGFTVEYSPERDRDLSLHIDDAEVTLNVCLGARFEGGALRVLGGRCLDHAQTAVDEGEAATVEHAVGTVLIHAGTLRHLAEPVLEGRRANLIVWCRSARFRRAHGVPARCGPWCARHAR